MRVTVAIVTRDRPMLLEAALYSVIGQSRKADQIVVVDDGTGPAAEELCRRFEGVTYARGPTGGGLAAARNMAVGAATGDIIVVQDDDDVMLPHRINDHLAAFDDGVDFNGGGWVNVASRTMDAVLRFSPGHAAPTLETLLLGNAAMAHGAAAYRTALLRAHPYDESLQAGADMHLHARLLSAGVRYRHTGTYTLARRLHSDSVSTRLGPHQKTVKDALRRTHLAQRTDDKIDAPLARPPIAADELGWALNLFGLDPSQLIVGAAAKTLAQAVELNGNGAPLPLVTGGFTDVLVPLSGESLTAIETPVGLVPRRAPDATTATTDDSDSVATLGLSDGGGRVLLAVDGITNATLIDLHTRLAPVSPAWRFASAHSAFIEAFDAAPTLVLVSNRYTSGPSLERAFKGIAEVVQGLGLPVGRLGVAMTRGTTVVGLRV